MARQVYKGVVALNGGAEWSWAVGVKFDLGLAIAALRPFG